jgi:hypothetical protein
MTDKVSALASDEVETHPKVVSASGTTNVVIIE